MLRVLTYHRIADPERTPALHPRLISATPAVFARHLDLLVQGYQVVSLEQALAAARGAARLPRRAVLLTFDDAYRDFQDAAWPLLRARRLPPALFVPTAYPGDPGRVFWWDRLHRAFTGTARAELALPGLPPLPLATPEARRSGLALLLRRGMWAWAQEAAAPCATARPPRSSRLCTSADDRQPAVVHLLAALAMRAPQRRPR